MYNMYMRLQYFTEIVSITFNELHHITFLGQFRTATDEASNLSGGGKMGKLVTIDYFRVYRNTAECINILMFRTMPTWMRIKIDFHLI
jgi:hypothetical protein